MTTSDLQELLGDYCAFPKLEERSTPEIIVSSEEFRKLTVHWKSLGVSSKPRLRGLTVSREPGASRSLRLLLSVAAGGDSLLLSTEFNRGSSLPFLHEIWPYAGWWENELRVFEIVKFPEAKKSGGVLWQLN